MSGCPQGLDPTSFLRTHWQRQWLYLAAALPDVPTLLTPEILAGLACEDEVESRIVVRRRDRWEVRHGPFEEDDFARLPARQWTLLVQNVETHLPELRSILRSFAFLPAWRLDDLMVSYAAPGGTVGAHIDDYDVFLLQGTGQREWQLDPAPADRACRPGLEVRVLRNFRAATSVRMRSGDLLYLPPGVAHYGAGDAPSMTFSVGFRAPSAADLLYAAAAQLEAAPGAGRYGDPDLEPRECSGGKIDAAAAGRVRRLLADAMPSDDAGLLEMLGRAATRIKPWLRPDPPTEPADPTRVVARLARGDELRRHAASRLAWAELDDQVVLFADGGAWRLPLAHAPLADCLTDSTEPDPATLAVHGAVPAAGEVLAALLAQGSLCWAEPTADGPMVQRLRR